MAYESRLVCQRRLAEKQPMMDSGRLTCVGGGSSKKNRLRRMLVSCALKALGQKPGSDLAVGVGNSWACPHHQCATCGRKAAAAGGLLFRCISCPQVPSPNRPSPKTTTLTLNLNLSLTLTLCGD